MIYQLSLQITGLVASLLLMLGHSLALFREEKTISAAKAFPRSRGAATVLLALAAVWSFWLVRTMDLGEFSNFRTVMLFAILAGAALAWLYVDEFLAVRALGILLLLAAEPLLESAILRNESTRLLVVVLAYIWIIGGLFFVGMPYVLRDLITWVTSCSRRWKLASLLGITWGAAMLICAIFFW